MNWTPERLNTAKAVLGEYPLGALPNALSRLSTVFKHKVTEDALVSAFRRAGWDRPSSFMAGAMDDPVEPVTKKRDEARLKTENKRLIELLEVEREKNAFLEKLGRPRPPMAITARERGRVREMAALAAMSDVHCEETVNPVKVQGRNKYNLDIADLRIKRFFQGIVDLIEHHRASKKIVVRDLVLWLGGDLITGHIHEELMLSAAMAPVETVLWLIPRLKAGIQCLLDTLDLDRIVIPCDIGNHGRTTEKRYITYGPETSYEWGMYCQLAREITDPRVRFDTSAANDHYVDIYSFRLHTTHGDSVKYGGGVGGLTVPLLKAVSSWDTDIAANWHLCGHFHTALDVDKLIVNGSMIGWGGFSKWIKSRYNPRDLSQHFSLVDKDRGRCHSTQIWVSSLKEELKFWTKAEQCLLTR